MTRLAALLVVLAACGGYDAEGYMKPRMVMSPDGRSWLYDIRCQSKAECMESAARTCKTHRYEIRDEASLGSESVGATSRLGSVSATVNDREMLIRCVTRTEIEAREP